MNLILDFGNSSLKIAVFKEDNSIIQKRISYNYTEILFELSELISNYKISKAILSSVVEVPKELLNFLKENINFVHFFSTETLLPFENTYQTKQTLGKDRLAAVAGAVFLFPQTPLLVIDSGTAITYEFVNEHNQYLGGNISPGLQTRFKALHEFTGKLPLLKPDDTFLNIGNSTTSAIISGVQQGIIFEIETYILKFLKEFPNAKVFLTGGDTNFFAKKLKYTIFANENLVLIGLNYILRKNH